MREFIQVKKPLVWLRQVGFALGWLLPVLALGLCAPAAAKPRIAVLLSKQKAHYKAAVDGFSRTLDSELKILAPKNGKDGVDAAALREVVEFDPDLVLAIGKSALQFARRNIKTTPVIFCMVIRPGKLPANFSGVSMSLPAKIHLESLLTLAPKIRSVGIVYNPTLSQPTVEEFRQAGSALRLKILAVAANTKAEAFSSIKLLGGKVDSLCMIMDETVAKNFFLLQKLALKEKIPLATFSDAYVKLGALVAISPEFGDLGRQVAEIGKRILAGTSPREIGLLTPDKYYTYVNKSVAQEIDVAIPAEIQNREHVFFR